MMVLSRKANDQNRTILVIYSNHPPTNFGIITAAHTYKKDGERDALRLTLFIYDYAIPKSASQGVGRILRPYNLPCFDRS